MKKLLISGCSYSYGIGLEENQKSWGQVLADSHNLHLINISKPGISVQYSIHNTVNYIEENNVDIVILQLTTLDRYPIPNDGERRFLTQDMTVKDTAPEVFHLLPANYLEAIDGKEFSVPTKVLRYFNEVVTYSTFYLNTLINEMVMLDYYLSAKGIRLIVVPYDDYFWGTESGINIWNFSESRKLNLREFIKYPFMKWLRDNYNENEFYVDNGFHLTEEGHRKFALEYLSKFITV